MCLFCTFHVNGILHYMTFCVWLLSLSLFIGIILAINWMFAYSQNSYAEGLLPKMIVLEGAPFGKCLGQESSLTLMIGISVFIKETPESSLVPYATWGYSKNIVLYEPGSKISPNIKSQHLVLGFPSLQNCEKHISVFYKSPILWHSVTAASMN